MSAQVGLAHKGLVATGMFAEMRACPVGIVRLLVLGEVVLTGEELAAVGHMADEGGVLLVGELATLAGFGGARSGAGGGGVRERGGTGIGGSPSPVVRDRTGGHVRLHVVV